MPLGRLNAPSTARSTAAEKYGARRRAVAWRAGYQTRIGNVRGFPVAGSIRVGSPRNADRTPIGHGPVGAGSASRAAATGARSSGADAGPAAGLASAAPAPAASQHAEITTATNDRAWLRGFTVGYTIAASLLTAAARAGQCDATPSEPIEQAASRPLPTLMVAELAAFENWPWALAPPGCDRTGAPGRPRRFSPRSWAGGRDGRDQPDRAGDREEADRVLAPALDPPATSAATAALMH